MGPPRRWRERLLGIALVGVGGRERLQRGFHGRRYGAGRAGPVSRPRRRHRRPRSTTTTTTARPPPLPAPAATTSTTRPHPAGWSRHRPGCPTPRSGPWCSTTWPTASRRSGSTSPLAMAPRNRRRSPAPRRWLTMESRDRDTDPHGAADIVVEPGREIRAPVTGTVIRAGTYTLYCDHVDQFAVIEPDARPGWEVKVLHIEGLALSKGQRVEAGVTRLAAHARVLPVPLAGGGVHRRCRRGRTSTSRSSTRRCRIARPTRHVTSSSRRAGTRPE